MSTLPTVVSFWRGPVTWIERLCVASMLEVGHRVEVFSYEPESLSKAGLECEIRDAWEVLPAPDDILPRNRGTTAEAVLSDVFRLHLMKQERGLWSDMDCLFLRPVDFQGEIFAWQTPDLIANGVLRLSADNPALDDYIAFTQKRPVICPWWTFEKAVRMRVRYALTGTSTPPTEGPFGPRALTYFLEKHSCQDAALNPDVFYSVPATRAADTLDPIDPVSSILSEETRIVHLWRGQLSKLPPPPPSSFVGKHLKRLSI